MVRNFTYTGTSAHIIFGDGASAHIGAWIEQLGCRRAVVLSTPGHAAHATAVATQLGALGAGTFTGAAMHTPIAVTEEALRTAAGVNADCVVSVGGGSTIGLGKAIAYRTDLPQIVVPTTYAGSEVTPILGQTEEGTKTTLRDPRVLPEVVIYDVELTLGLPVALSATSGLNALAHAAEGLYADDRNPIATLMAVEGMGALNEALPAIVKAPRDIDARSEALYGAWLCGSVLGSVSMALHHKICHTLGGSFDTPHAATHAVMLPHTIGFNAVAVPELLAPVAQLFGGPPGAGLYDFANAIGAPMALRDLGLSAADLDRAAEIATGSPYANPREVDRRSVRALLQEAWEGARPQA